MKTVLEETTDLDPLLSVASPVFCEEACIEEFHSRLTEVLSRLVSNGRWEVIYVDDGSTDRTWDLLVKIRESDRHVKLIRLSRNFGHQAASSAAIDAAQGAAVVLIDSDLQDPPEVIEEMFEKWKAGYKVVYGQRVSRLGESRWKTSTASIFYRLLNWLSEVDLPPDVGDFRLMDRQVALVLCSMPERSRYLRGMVAWIGFKQCAVPYQRDPRFGGSSKYPLRKMVRLAIDAMAGFTDRPLRIASRLGIGMISAAVLFTAWILLATLFQGPAPIRGWTSLIVAILALGGAQLLCVGLLGEYVARIFRETQRRPIYIIAEHSKES